MYGAEWARSPTSAAWTRWPRRRAGSSGNRARWRLGNPPLWYRYGHGDVAAAMPSVLALLIALFHRNRTAGRASRCGCRCSTARMLYTADSWLGPDGAPSPRPSLDAGQLGLGPLYRLYETADGWLQLAAVRERTTGRALCGALGRPDWPGTPGSPRPTPATSSGAELGAVLEEAFLSDLAVNWRRALDAAGVPSEISVDTWDGETVLFDEELVRLGLVTEYEHPLLGRVRQFGNLITFSDTPGKQERAAPMVGQHTREILAELGYDDAAIDALAADGVVTWPDATYPFPV